MSKSFRRTKRRPNAQALKALKDSEIPIEDATLEEFKPSNKALFEKVVRVVELYDYEVGNEFFLVAPVANNDMYNQN